MRWESISVVLDEAGHLILAENDRQLSPLLGVGRVVNGPGTFESLGEKEAEGRNPLRDRVVGQLADTKQVSCEFADLVGTKLVGRTMEEAREVLDRIQVHAPGRFSVITTLEFLEHHFSKMGHKDLLVTRPYRHSAHNARVAPREASAVRLSSNAAHAIQVDCLSPC